MPRIRRRSSSADAWEVRSRAPTTLSASDSVLELYHEDVSDPSEFYLLGYWGETAAPEANGLFADVSSDAGFNLQTSTSNSGPSSIHWADFDGDGDLDALVTGTASRILINSGSSTFTPTNFAGGSASGQAAILDVDNDGDIDIWHHSGGLNENNGSGVFTSRGGVGFTGPSGSVSTIAADVDGNGYTDIITFAANGNWIGRHSRKVNVALNGTTDTTFGLNGVDAFGNGGFACTADADDDGDLDIFYNYGVGRLFLSDGDGTFTKTGGGIAVANGDSEPVGSSWGDYDNDGDMDLFVPRNASGNPGYLWRNNGRGTFTNVTAAAGIDDTSGHRGCCWGDYDNDGDLDLYICTGASTNILYRNNGDSTFTAVDEDVEASGNSQDAVFVDYDNDGDLDLAVTRQGGTNVLLENSTDNTDYLKVRVIGQGMLTNKVGLGVRVDLYDSTGRNLLARREIGTARGYGGSSPLWAHFGGVTNSSTYVVKVHFPSGVTSTSVVPVSASTTIGSTVIAQMVTITERQPQLTIWQETNPRD